LNQRIIVRIAARPDLDAIARLWLGLVDYHQQLDPRLPPAAPDGARRYAARIEDRLDDSSMRVLVAERDGRIVGYVLAMVVDLMSDLFVHETCGFVADIYVASEARRDGVGRALVDQLLLWFYDQGIEYYEWHVAAHNRAGQAFWQAVGGQPVLIRMRSGVSSAPSDDVNQELS